jgi:peptide/nickel transport system permease protein
MADLAQANRMETGPAVEEEIESGGEKVYVAPPWKLMWWRFRKHKMALISAVVLIIFYLIAAFCEFVAPYDPDQALIQFKQAPPTEIHIRDAQGQFHWPFVYQHKRAMDPRRYNDSVSH